MRQDNKQCPSCGGNCGYTKAKGCQYGSYRPPALIALNALGHIRTSNTRCTARHREVPKEKRIHGPAPLPMFCSLKAGHEGPHYNTYGTNRHRLQEGETEMVPLPDLCKKCRTIWPCKDAKAVIDAFAN